jgi:GNAT superfamily N-acetyltransferase
MICSFFVSASEFEEGQEFRGAGEASHLILKFSKKVKREDSAVTDTYCGFYIHHDNHKGGEPERTGYIAYVYLKFKTQDIDFLNVSWVYVYEQHRNQNFGKKAFNTFLSIIKECRNEKFPLAKRVKVQPIHPGMKKIVTKAGFTPKNNFDYFYNLV